ncbi:histidine ammonia-lyase [Symbiobacterium thermophilum]|uniref:Histidine ammonia-lyase n=3 Tax=Symbiobacterium thermophilum TaxID=2734 RepID=HUTH_SYMTH|nr:histidine ammonia-lyase [Symbiobacterium thermophilum]Q67JH4.1 RecName: Full=Histidine ammonia-lyase; Short=Histidase [Symbiobacterium thermophilum IAM 14863]MBY6276436.1 histidine ammonia-lyase [Symbiobacterium thermophilum]BAD42176.1 histidine ammonia-lyase [Symbiobacterium thermophilum IAM 14863]
MEAVELGAHLTLPEVVAVARHGARVVLTPEVRQRVARASEMVERLVRERRPVYGITTGFGKFSDVPISAEQTEALQRNLLMSHACAVGEPLAAEVVRAMLLLRAQALSRGHSGIRAETLEMLVAFLNLGLTPVVPEQGSLGASGDLAPLAHMSLPLIGLGEAVVNGERLSGAEALQRVGLRPLTLTAKEGLALINGTQAMTALGSLGLHDAQVLLKTADIAAAMTAEALGAIPAAWDPRVQALRLHTGQQAAARNLRRLTEGSRLTTRPGQMRTQDPYTLRCLPQVHGASRTAIEHVAQVLDWEMNAVTDNPLLFPDDDEVISGGNFHGQPVALALDYLAIAVAELGDIAERRIERLVNPQLSGLPAFLTRNGGVHSGLMITQYTAASLVSENKVLAHPASVDSIPSSANQEDHVSMGTTAARKARQVIANVRRVLAIELLCAAQALEFVGPERLAPATRAAYAAIRERVAPLSGDRVLAPDIEALAELVHNGELVAAVEAVAGPLE